MFPCHNVILRNGSLPSSFLLLLPGDLYAPLNWVAFGLSNDIGFCLVLGPVGNYLDHCCRRLLQCTRATPSERQAVPFHRNSIVFSTVFRAHNKENIKAPFYRSLICEGDYLVTGVTGRFPLQRASNAQSVSIT